MVVGLYNFFVQEITSLYPKLFFYKYMEFPVVGRQRDIFINFLLNPTTLCAPYGLKNAPQPTQKEF